MLNNMSNLSSWNFYSNFTALRRWHNYRMDDHRQDEFTLQTHFSALTVYYKVDGDWTEADNSSLKKNTLWFFLKLISATDWYINNTDWSDIKKEDRHWTSYVSKATGLLEATAVFHPWSANAQFPSSCLQKPLSNNKWPLSQKRGHNPHHHSHTRDVTSLDNLWFEIEAQK